jgi:hypothetical protein
VDEEGEERMSEVKPDSAQTCALLDAIRRGEAQALEDLLQRHRPQLHDKRFGRALIHLKISSRTEGLLE